MDDNFDFEFESVFETICRTFDRIGYTYEADEESQTIISAVKGDDIPMPVRFVVRPDREIVMLYSVLPFDINPENRMEVALALTVINNNLIDGSFDYDITEGKIVYRMTACYRDSVLGTGLFEYMLSITLSTVDDFNDKLFMLNEGIMDFDQFMRSLQN